MVLTQGSVKKDVVIMQNKNLSKLHVLLASPKYAGKYVAFTQQEKDRKVVASSRNASVAIKKARERGVKEPVIVHVPKDGRLCAY